jgi:FKBP-type peptidyl-prolyl cis-trans isomerase
MPSSSIRTFHIDGISILEGIVMEPPEAKTYEDVQIQYIHHRDSTEMPVSGSTVVISFSAFLANGNLLETHPPEAPLRAKIGAGTLVPGLERLLCSLSVGSQARAIVPWSMAYGASGVTDRVPPKTNIIYEVFLSSIEK